jgi:hypothetical protein
MVMVGREYAGAEYKFGFNTQEKEVEIGHGITSAEFWVYNCVLGKRWNVDPVENHSESPYLCFSNNPIVLVDPLGSTDFYNTKGNWIGTDGQDNSVKRIVTNSKIAKDVKRLALKGKPYIKELPNTAFNEAPSKNVLDAIKYTYEVSIIPTALDPVGDKHEASTRFDASGNRETVIGIRPSELWSCNTDAGIDRGRHCIISGPVSIHTHPIGLIHCNSADVVIDGNRPSVDDKVTFTNFQLNIIIGRDGDPKALTTTTVVDQSKVTSGGAATTATVEKTIDNRPLNVYFFDKNSTSLWSISYNNLMKLNDDTNKKENKTFKKYEQNSAKK